MSENETQVQVNLWRVLDIYKTAGLLDDMVLLENISFFALCWYFRDELNQVKALNFENQYIEHQPTPFRKAYDELDHLIARRTSAYSSGQAILPSVSSELRGPQQIDVFRLLFEIFDAVPHLGQWFDGYLIPYLSSISKGGRYATPRHLIHFMAQMVGLKSSDSLADFACGTGGMLVANGKLKKATGVEISINIARLALTNLILHGQEHTLHVGNTFDLNKNLSDDEQFDIVLMNPPWGAKLDPYLVHSTFNWRSFFSGLKGKSETLFTALAYERLKPGGRMAIMVPSGFLFSTGRGETSLREYLVRENALQAIVSLPQPINNVSTHVVFAVKPENNNQKQQKGVWFYQPRFDGLSTGKKQRPDPERNDLPVVHISCNVKRNNEDVQVTPLILDKNDYAEVVGYRVEADDNSDFRIRALANSFLIALENKAGENEWVYVRNFLSKFYRGRALPQKGVLGNLKKSMLAGEFNLFPHDDTSYGYDASQNPPEPFYENPATCSLWLSEEKGEIRKGDISKARFGKASRTEQSAFGILVDDEGKLISGILPFVVDKLTENVRLHDFRFLTTGLKQFRLLIFYGEVDSYSLKSESGESLALLKTKDETDLVVLYDAANKKVYSSVEEEFGINFKTEIFRSDLNQRGVVFDHTGSIIGIYISREEILNTKNATLQSDEYWESKQKAITLHPPARILGDIKKKQNQLTSAIDRLLSISEIQSIAGTELPARLKMSEHSVGNLQGMQKSIWAAVQTQIEQVNGYATPIPFQSDDIKVQLTEKVSVKDVQSTLELFERMGLIIAVSYEGIPYFRLPEERDWVIGEQA